MATAPELDEHRDRRPLGLEDGVLDVSEVLAVDVQRQRDVAADLDPVEVVLAEEPAIARRGRSGREPPPTAARRRDLDRRDEVEAVLELGLAHDRQRDGPAYVYGLPFATKAAAARP